MREQTKKQIKSGARDKYGIRIADYNKTMKNRSGITKQNSDPEMVTTLLDTLEIGLFGTTATGDGQTVETRGVRSPKYEDINAFMDKVREYFSYIRNTYKTRGVELIPDIEGLCSYLNISRECFLAMPQRSQEWNDLIMRIRSHIAGYKKQKGMNGEIPPLVMALDFNNNHGYVQKQNIEIDNKISIQELPSIEEIRDKLPE